jgi:dihydropteroate synthase
MSKASPSRRVLPVVRALAADGASVSIDTMRANVARQAIEAGAAAVNDVSGGLADEAMLPLVAEANVPYICMHWRGHSQDMQSRATYADVVEEVVEELADRVKAAEQAGIDRGRLAIDPGLGFAKTAEHNWALLHGLDRLHRLELPVLVAASRKTFLGRLLADQETGELRPTRDRDDASSATSALAAMAGVWCVRVHAVRPSLDAVRVAARWAAEPHGV